jgi:serine/threonine protein kinase/cyclophilin family peptidyl-prolyl cis-trans isomerase
MGEVWRAYDSGTDRIVAIKLLPPHLSDHSEFKLRFQREAQAAAKLDTPHVIPIYDYGDIDDRLYVCMRLIEGRDLQKVLTDGPLKPSRAVRIIEQVAMALQAAHEVGLLHRDVKPSNILLDKNDFAYLIDFGIARALDDTRMTKTGFALGTYHYIAPERLGKRVEEDARADVYSLACVLYECLTGRTPFDADNVFGLADSHRNDPPPRPSASQPNLPEQIDEVIATGMAKEPGNRYATTVELAGAARDAITVPIQRSTPSPGAFKPTARLGPDPEHARGFLGISRAYQHKRAEAKRQQEQRPVLEPKAGARLDPVEPGEERLISGSDYEQLKRAEAKRPQQPSPAFQPKVRVRPDPEQERGIDGISYAYQLQRAEAKREQQREEAKRKLERQLARRVEQTRGQRVLAIIGGAILAATAVGVVVLAIAIVNTKPDNSDTSAASNTASSYAGTTTAAPQTAPVAPLPPSANLLTNCRYPTSADNAARPVKPPVSGQIPTGPPPQSANIVTNQGEIGLTLDNNESPCTVSNFASLTRQGFYNNTKCHRLTTAPDLSVLQCGDPKGDGTGGPGYGFGNEYPTDQYARNDPKLQAPIVYPRGTLAMANSGQPNSNGSQFFMVYKDSQLPPQYTIFGTVEADGLATLDKIAKAGVAGGGDDGPPAIPVTIKSVTLD